MASISGVIPLNSMEDGGPLFISSLSVDHGKPVTW